jgi:hypothetical protein
VRVQEYVELLFGEAEKLTVANRRPAHVRHGTYVVANEFWRKPTINAFVRQCPHEAVATMCAFAS